MNKERVRQINKALKDEINFYKRMSIWDAVRVKQVECRLYEASECIYENEAKVLNYNKVNFEEILKERMVRNIAEEITNNSDFTLITEKYEDRQFRKYIARFYLGFLKE